MTQISPPNLDQEDDRKRLSTTSTSGSANAMRIIVPLQGIVQGRGGLFLGSVIPCALFYLFQLYLRRSRSKPSSPLAPAAEEQATGGSSLHRSSSRLQLFSRGRAAQVSSRAVSMIKPSNSLSDVGINKFLDDPFDEIQNPNGIMQLGLDRCELSTDIVSQWFAETSRESLIIESPSIGTLATYQPFDGTMKLKLAVADFMTEALGGVVAFHSSHIVLTASLSSAMEILSFCLADSGNAFLVPTPYDPCWDGDMKLRTGVELVHVPCHSSDNFSINISALDRVFNQTKNRGVKVRGLLISNPSNPVGRALDAATLHGLLDFAVEKNIHIISNEKFVLSVGGTEGFNSAAQTAERDDHARDRVHIVYGLSDDLSLPGSTTGAIYSFNGSVVSAAKNLARFSSPGALNQHLIASVLSDRAFVGEFLRSSRERLRSLASAFAGGMNAVGVKCRVSDGGLYCWADMSAFIGSYSERGELQLWEKLLDVAKVSVTPGSLCHCIEPGWFRFNLTVLKENHVPVVVERVRRLCP